MKFKNKQDKLPILNKNINNFKKDQMNMINSFNNKQDNNNNNNNTQLPILNTKWAKI